MTNNIPSPIYKNWWFWISLIIVIGILAFIGYKWYQYNQCKNEEGNICGTRIGIGLREISGTTPINIPVSKRTKCNFWKGKTCE